MTHAAEKIALHLARRGWSSRRLADEAGIAEATLRRKAKAPDTYTVGELGRIAYALDVDVRTLLPDSLLNVATPGGRS